MNTSKRYAVERDRDAEAIRSGAEFAHRVWEEHLDRLSVAQSECYGGIYLDSDTLLCVCPLCHPQPESGCYCPVCMMVRRGAQ